MKKKRYSAVYKGKSYTFFAFCEEEVYWRVLNKNGISFQNNLDQIAENRVEIWLS